MRLIYAVHIAAGVLALIAGYVALYVAKGDKLHRTSGRLFVYAMLVVGAAGTTIVAVKGIAPAINISAAVFTSYLVITALITVRPISSAERLVTSCLMLIAVALVTANVKFGYDAVTSDTGMTQGIPPFPYFMFATFAFLAVIGDIRVIRNGALRGTARIRRHLWRMGHALFIAALSFFIGQAKVFPDEIRIIPLLALPVLAVIVTTVYWMWSVRKRRDFPSRVGSSIRQRVSNPAELT